MTNQKILFVSDSLGTPIHARGIFNFSYGIVQILKDLSFSVDLLVEPPTAGVYNRVARGAIDTLSTIQAKAVLADLFKHFQGDRFSFEWHYPNRAFQRLCDEFPDLANLQLTIDDGRRVEAQKYLPADQDIFREFRGNLLTDHLLLFDGFVISPRVYGESFRRAIHGVRPNIVDAAGYDYVFVDTPHCVDFINIPQEKIIFVVHDVIPLIEWMAYDWREMFVNKLSATAKAGRNGIFVSETTRSYFEELYPALELTSSTIIYPPVRKEVANAAQIIGRKLKADYIRDIADNKAAEFAGYALKSSDQPAEVERTRWRANKPAASAMPTWNGDLPYFCTVLSDEPRKNITVLVEASKMLVGRANIVVMGQINGNAHMNERPELFPNLHFTGYVSNGQKFDLLSACEAFIFPSFSEGFGIPIIEAALFGAPIICSDIPVFREVTDGKAAFFPPSDADALVAQIERFLNDPAERDTGGALKSFAQEAFVQSSLKGRLASIFAHEEV
ncbi:glycosyltransferase [Novosphingobium capsulatum]|uniref:glycosyltransferase n=1 Tax=Novosphingobium capsulatum TaxID=13688 RepID=UPI000B07D9FA|nr:glycosyltransferase [Novosphingobium capsulatum]WQD94149.1 glycosyltransferase [Novosphingobium capsulatum]